MKIKKTSRLASIFTRIFNVRAWADFDRTKAVSINLFNGLKTYFIPQKKTEQEKASFEEMVKRMNLSAESLQTQQTAFYRLAMLMCGAAVLVFSYAVYHFFAGQYKAALISFVLVIVALAFAFRYHFWYFQIKERKLGCSLGEWFTKGIKGVNHE